MTDFHYTYEVDKTALGVRVKFHGPGFSHHMGYGMYHPLQELNDWAERTVQHHPKDTGEEWFRHEAERVVAALEVAYKAGKKAKQKEILNALGVFDREH